MKLKAKRAGAGIVWLLLLALVLWWLYDGTSKASPTGEVILGAPTVTGSSATLDGADYNMIDPSSLNSPNAPGGT